MLPHLPLETGYSTEESIILEQCKRKKERKEGVQETAPIVVRRGGGEQQKMGRSMTMKFADGRRPLRGERVAAVEEAERPRTATEMDCHASRA